jgi:hypothetical protein
MLETATSGVIAKMKRRAVRELGAAGFLQLAAALRAVGAASDTAAEGLELAEVHELIRTTIGLELNGSDMEALSEWLDRTGEHVAATTELAAALRAIPSPWRRSLVRRVVASFEAGKGEAATLPAVLARFQSSHHPAVLRGEATAAAARAEFEEAFNPHIFPRGVVSAQALELYLSGVSATMEADDEFAAYVRGAWALPEFDPATTQCLASVAAAPGLRAAMPVREKAALLRDVTLLRALDETVAHHRRTIEAAAPRTGYRALGVALRAADVYGSGLLPRAAFLECLASLRLYVAHAPTFDALAADGDDRIDYVWYLDALVGELPPVRKLHAERLWAQLPKRAGAAGSGARVAVDELQRHFRAQNPTPTELAQFLDAWDQRRASGAVVGARAATLGSFELLNEWLVPVSQGIEQDSAFLAYLRQQWGLRN